MSSPKSLAILGRQPALGLAELESLYGANHISKLDGGAVLDIEASQIDLKILGGTIKLCKILTVLDTADWNAISKWLAEASLNYLQHLPAGKLKLGLSVYGNEIKISLRQLSASALSLKKVIQARGRNVRVVPNQSLGLSSAQVIHNKLTGPLGWELVFVGSGSKTYVAQTVAIQDIESYASRDQKRPKRDARVGMLPPKLAQTIINLANPSKGSTILDPFCGTGVILQEALLMDFSVSGSDVDPRMVEYSTDNLRWLQLKGTAWQVAVADATKGEWPKFDTIASETYLGRPFTTLPKPDVLNKVVSDVDTIIKKFLKNVADQTKAGFRMCIAVPSWKTSNGFVHLPTLDHLKKIGYTRVSFVHANNQDLIYHREGQIVARELLVLRRD